MFLPYDVHGSGYVRPGRPEAEVLGRREEGKGRVERDNGESSVAAASRDEHGASSSERADTVSSSQVPDQRVGLHGVMRLSCWNMTDGKCIIVSCGVFLVCSVRDLSCGARQFPSPDLFRSLWLAFCTRSQRYDLGRRTGLIRRDRSLSSVANVMGFLVSVGVGSSILWPRMVLNPLDARFGLLLVLI